MVQPSGAISVNNQKLVDAVAASPTFQKRVNQGDPSETEARTRIHWPHFDRVDAAGAEITIVRPLAVIQSGTHEWVKFAGGADNALRPGGSALLILEDNDRFKDEANDKNGQIDFENFVGGVLADLAAGAGEDDSISIVGIRQRMPAATVHPKDEAALGKWWRTVYQIDWGWV